LLLIVGLLPPVFIAAQVLPDQLWGDKHLGGQASLVVMVVLGLAWVMLGYVLWSGASGNITRPDPLP